MVWKDWYLEAVDLVCSKLRSKLLDVKLMSLQYWCISSSLLGTPILHHLRYLRLMKVLLYLTGYSKLWMNPFVLWTNFLKSQTPNLEKCAKENSNWSRAPARYRNADESSLKSRKKGTAAIKEDFEGRDKQLIDFMAKFGHCQVP